MPNYEFKRNRMKQQTPQVALKTCWDGSVIPENQVCPAKPLKPTKQQMQQTLMGGTQGPTFNKNKVK